MINLLRFHCFDLGRSYIYGPENPNMKLEGPMMLGHEPAGAKPRANSTNIKFGLEMRRLPVGDGGLAIHVLADLAGSTESSYVEETEILAFDCFWDGPHSRIRAPDLR